MKLFAFFSRFSLIVAVCTLTARADMIELINGDHYRGFVIGMTASNVDFLSEIQGRVKLPRDKVAQITLHEATPRLSATNQPAGVYYQTNGAGQVVSAAPAQIALPPQTVTVQPLILTGPQVGTAPAPARSGTAQSVIQQMQQQGVDPKLIQEVQEQIFGKASPEAAAQFNQMMGGLMSGSMSVKDLRAQAQNSIAQIKAAKRELGPDVDDALDGYLGILLQFVNEAASDDTITTSQPVAAATK